MSLPGRAKAPRPLRRQVGGSKARGIYLLGVAATLGLGCNRAPQGPVLGDPDPGTVYPVFEVRLHEGSLSRTVSLPYVAPVTAEPVLASFEFQFPDSVVGTAAYLAVSVDDRAEVTLNGAILGAVEDVGELELGVCYPSVPLRIALRCSAYAEPARLRGVWLIVRPGRVRQLRLLESELARFLELPFQRWEEWEWRPSSGPGAQWKRGGLGLTWSGSGEKRWFRTRLPWPSTVNGFLTNGDSLWLRLAVDDSATVFVDGRLVGAIRRQGGVPLGHRWEGEQEILVEVTNRRGRGSFEGAWIGSGRLAALRPQLDSLLRALYRYRLLLEQHPDPPSDWESAVSRALREIREALASEPRECSSLGAALGRAWPHLSRLEIALRQFPPFVCGPYLQNVGPHQITVMWETPVACRGRVWYREESEGRWRKAEEASTRRVHELTLRNLKPDTRYSYCAQNGKAISALRHFRSAPIHRRPFRLAVWGDSRSDPRMHETVARRISEHCPDLAIHVGDVVGHGANWDEWTQMYFLPARGLLASAPSYIAIGNHEYGGFGYGKPVPPFEVYVSHPGNEYYFSFDYAGCHFIILDSNRPAEGGVPLGRQQFAWLLEDLGSEASRKADWRFVFLHHPPYSEAWDWGGYYDGEPLLREKLMPVLADYRVSFVFSGHTHDYERGRMPRAEGTYLVITGGGGAELDNLRYRDWPEIDRQEFAYHFCLLDVDSTRIHFRAIRHDGSILDEFTVDRAP